MKLLFGLFILAFCFTANFAQATSFEADFEKNKAKYKLDIFSEGEDASSGFDYLIYKKGEEIIKVREIWSSLSYTTYRIEDYYFKNGKVMAYVKYDFAKKFYNAAKKGRKVPMNLTETLLFTDSMMTTWTENGKNIEKTDSRWAETEKGISEKAESILESYKNYLAESK